MHVPDAVILTRLFHGHLGCSRAISCNPRHLVFIRRHGLHIIMNSTLHDWHGFSGFRFYQALFADIRCSALDNRASKYIPCPHLVWRQRRSDRVVVNITFAPYVLYSEQIHYRAPSFAIYIRSVARSTDLSKSTDF